MGREEKSWSPVSGRFSERCNVMNSIRTKLVRFGTCKLQGCLDNLFLLIGLYGRMSKIHGQFSCFSLSPD